MKRIVTGLLLASLLLGGCSGSTGTQAVAEKESSSAEEASTEEEEVEEEEEEEEEEETETATAEEEDDEELSAGLDDIMAQMANKDIFATWEIMEDGDHVVLTPKPASFGLDEDTKIGSLTVTFGELCDAASEVAPGDRPFPAEFFRQIVSCELLDNSHLRTEVSVDEINLVLAYYAAIAYEFGDKELECKNVQMFSDFPTSMVFAVVVDGEDQVWIWDKADNSFFVGEDEYTSSMFDESNLSIFGYAFEDAER